MRYYLNNFNQVIDVFDEKTLMVTILFFIVSESAIMNDVKFQYETPF